MTTNRRLRVVYFGTPEFAVPALRSLISDNRFDVSLVVTQPDRPAGRGHKLSPSPVKIAALQTNLQIYQPSSLRTENDRRPLVDIDADLFAVAAYGRILGPKTLAIPRVWLCQRSRLAVAEVQRSESNRRGNRLRRGANRDFGDGNGKWSRYWPGHWASSN